jgi:N6-adenosine-specific RNA methylase IME4/DNA-binding XRE family transcriptional regulator
MIPEQAARRNMTPEQLAEVKQHLRKLALELRKAGRTQLEISRLLRVPQQTISRWMKESNTHMSNICLPDCRVSIPKSEYGRIYARARAGESHAQIAADYGVTRQRISQIIKLVEARSRSRRTSFTQPFPRKKYRCLVIDPPWPVQKIEREERPNQGRELDYPTMSLEEIAGLPIPELADPSGCHVYLWVTHKFLPEGLELFKRWGVKYQCVLTWVKPTGMTPFSWMYNTEHVLFGRIGNLDHEKRGDTGVREEDRAALSHPARRAWEHNRRLPP